MLTPDQARRRSTQRLRRLLWIICGVGVLALACSPYLGWTAVIIEVAALVGLLVGQALGDAHDRRRTVYRAWWPSDDWL